MNAIDTLLTIQVHLEDGQTVSFAQTHPQAVRTLIDHLQPTKLFTQHHIAIGGVHSLTAFPCARIVQVDFIAPNLPQWPHFHGVHTLVEITEEQFRERYQPESYDRLTPGEVSIVYSEIELINGKRHFVEVTAELESRMPQEQNIFLQQLLSGGGLHITRSEVGLIVVNPIHIVRISLYPGRQALPPNAWVAEPI